MRMGVGEIMHGLPSPDNTITLSSTARVYLNENGELLIDIPIEDSEDTQIHVLEFSPQINVNA